MSKIGVIGAGIMGTGVAQRFAQFGHNIKLIDISEEVLEKAREQIVRNIRFHNMVSKNDASIDLNNVLEKIKFTVDYSELEDAEFIIENVPEIWSIKEKVYKKLDTVCKKDCIFMVNTSCISITKVASITTRRDKVIGTHFMNPVPMKKATETIKGYHTSSETIKAVENLLNSVGKESILVNDLPGFVSNRVSHLLMNEAAYVVQDNVASPEDVDLIFKKCFEHKMGPLETADLIGLDTVVNSLDILYESYQDPKFRCCPLLRKMVDAGLFGRKSGKGFYDYI
ncbi:3-hydroxybutyryl-CoA dehydrogenase [Clostridium cavendishii DSM 21758]|uniref:3-hydroxybutyryl-CoA dehydrogenase n=1 Tax=Clostridium cavendishii DSM 21758 TaxID=1121302 RepID=A0A1M6KW22_9CLOT|nr:3-hydroxyacyl-CoA dehydrogenase NAD-binding domain-containing protein [Clostridium cavendishii]SHJ63175.1 3-hydroxybutyryl-CoA dehydrogenase [Clostridium cavendishii DSM 21758]